MREGKKEKREENKKGGEERGEEGTKEERRKGKKDAMKPEMKNKSHIDRLAMQNEETLLTGLVSDENGLTQRSRANILVTPLRERTDANSFKAPLSVYLCLRVDVCGCLLLRGSLTASLRYQVTSASSSSISTSNTILSFSVTSMFSRRFKNLY